MKSDNANKDTNANKKWRLPLMCLVVLVVPPALACLGKLFVSLVPSDSWIAWLLSGFTTDNVLNYLAVTLSVLLTLWVILDETKRRREEEAARMAPVEPCLIAHVVEGAEDDNSCVVEITNIGNEAVFTVYYGDQFLCPVIRTENSFRFELAARADIVKESRLQGKTSVLVDDAFDTGTLPDELYIQIGDKTGHLWDMALTGIFGDDPRMKDADCISSAPILRPWLQ